MSSFLRIRNAERFDVSSVPQVPIEDLRTLLSASWRQGGRVVDMFGMDLPGSTRLFVIGRDPSSGLWISSAELTREFPSFTPNFPAVFMFERELTEERGIRIPGLPRPRPVRRIFPGTGPRKEEFPFLPAGTEEMHEVAVGPVHAGIIEPGHFRFLCHGEKIYHLEIQLGYQHRGIAGLIRADLRDARFNRASCLAESIAGDTSVGHSWAMASVLEALSEIGLPDRDILLRSAGLELERAAVHIGDLGALSGDVAFLPGQSYFGGFRTLAINSMLEWCGNRFGRGLIGPGRQVPLPDGDLRKRLDRTLAVLSRRVVRMGRSLFSSASVLSRFEKCGIVDSSAARELGLTGPAGRASGLRVDARIEHPIAPLLATSAPPIAVREEGDVLSRAAVRLEEIRWSLDHVRQQFSRTARMDGRSPASPEPRPDSMAVAIVEGWRGEIVHAAVTDGRGRVCDYRIKDPSLTNWAGLAEAVRGNPISDFPLCNKSFNLSYCGHDL